ncbi:hypothetical protein PVK06_008873 [Gossypium arboreum]|uniref:Uncharacterized protein n=1 Tax=Gossypium arboreum TaxID=29729 RepID=A0ABR0QL16_GOSAR|nr:hypothetical protein PVK06_008873 [Gossypium arboreum]
MLETKCGLASWALRKACAETEAKQELQEKVHQLEILEKQHLVEKEKIWRQKSEALEKYKPNTQKSIQEYLPNLRANMILCAQVTIGLLDLSQLNFNCIRRHINANLNYNTFNPSRLEWEEFQRKWKGSRELFYA